MAPQSAVAHAELFAPRGRAVFDLTLDAPAPRQRVTTPVAWVEVRGRTGFAELFETDVVIALDLSHSAMLASGIDLDEDGVVGRNRSGLGASPAGRQRTLVGATRLQADRVPMHRWTTDPDDVVARAELEAAHAIIGGLWPRRNRIGIVTYGDRARVRARVGEPRLAGEALDRIALPRDRSETNLAAALHVAQGLLEDRSLASEPRRDRAILVFTDGWPTEPNSDAFARAVAKRTAARIAASGTRLYVLSFGNLDETRARFVAELATAASGVLVPVRDPKRLLQDLASVELAPRRLVIHNQTLDRGARAVHAERQGHFRGFVPLAVGDNEIRIEAVLGNGREVGMSQTVHYAPSPEPTLEERREAARLLVSLRERTRELETRDP